MNEAFPPGLPRAPDPLPQNCHIKKPRLIWYDRIRQGTQLNAIVEAVLLQAAVCELLVKHPHPNIAAYLGCQVSQGRITGLCFAAYQCTLMPQVNRAPASSDVMLDGRGEAVIIDFGSCKRVGESLEGASRTYERYDERVGTARLQNDLDALAEMRTRLGDGARPFLFGE
ncbi:hypothetical protein B0T26DRAFT_755705 [Lasiosphaeria miniovina]|uniref:Protein kinase domain-containing protein n=1 Tax=Lasiosphaeria miniovina TaxID=1954250 RepID=A0AA39ZYX4_9PEZI|nr:uncharacterized protein B0T26DRAFT_755705 [Lasiosphaeria miniovina]KAK0706180.1 hypothetical protein B0T26DRAFT_755705 [Lasiosphaeria miniovina]